MTDHSNHLDPEELLHLALNAIQTNSTDKALELLKRLVKIDPENGKALYLMGATHAEIGMYDRAISEMGSALELEPELHTARFQLGLLHLTSGNVSEAETAWADLDALGNQDALFLFKKGMLHLVKDEFEPCAEALASGLEVNTFNEDLNNDMRRVLQDVTNILQKQPAQRIADSDDSSATDGKHILLSVYQNKADED